MMERSRNLKTRVLSPARSVNISLVLAIVKQYAKRAIIHAVGIGTETIAKWKNASVRNSRMRKTTIAPELMSNESN